jgi:hypothetical protein
VWRIAFRVAVGSKGRASLYGLDVKKSFPVRLDEVASTSRLVILLTKPVRT